MTTYRTKETYHYESHQNGQLVGSMDKEYQNGQLINHRSFGNIPRSIESSFQSRSREMMDHLSNNRSFFENDFSRSFFDLSLPSRSFRKMLPERSYNSQSSYNRSSNSQSYYNQSSKLIGNDQSYKPIGKEWVLYGSSSCPYTNWAQQLMNQKGIPYQYYEIEKAPFYSRTNYERMMKDVLENQKTIPIIFHNGRLIGGYRDLVKYLT